ncbi:MAG: sporulation protein YqfD, partial [Clostridia bacterium]|nr:sporulation protein YqfD [Clostridia bacterium]
MIHKQTMHRFISKLTGFYELRSFEGKGIEFLNALNASGAYVWRLQSDGTAARARVSVFGYKTAIKAISGLGRAEKAYGLQFIILKYKKRAGLAVGSALGLILIFVSTLFAWEIEITGNKNVSEKEILFVLEELGVKSGAFIPAIDVGGTNDRLVSALPELSSASLHIDGTKLCVDVIERVRPPEKANTAGVYDVVAARDGIVTRMEAYNGRPEVKAGDTVVKGQVLISGYYTAGDDPRVDIATHASGKVTAEYYKEFVYTVPLDHRFRSYTGKVEKRVVYGMFGGEIKAYMGKAFPFALFEAELDVKNLTLGPLKLPVTKTTLTLREYEYETF